jgi:CheY-like chemotaxis protein
MGGDIQVESTINEGTTISFDIKVQMAITNDLQMPLERGAIISNNNLDNHISNYRILLVDDKYESRFLMKNLLSPLGFEIREAVNGQEAIAIWRSWQPHLIWMDMQMPIMDGYEATKTIRAAESPESACKIIALTASVFDTQRLAMLDLGCDDFVSKPIQENIIFDKIAEHLGVIYTYAKDEAKDSEPNQVLSNFQQSSNQDWQNLDTAWLLKLDLAARAADEEEIFMLLTQIQDQYPAIATLVKDLVDNFHLDRIVNIIEPLLK